MTTLTQINQHGVLGIPSQKSCNGFIDSYHKSPIVTTREIYTHRSSNGHEAQLLETPVITGEAHLDSQSFQKALLASDQRVLDIRSKGSCPLDLHAKTLEGLSQPSGSKFLPSLLLWDNKGQGLYGDILETKHYYPYRVENELLEQQIHDIGKKVASTGCEVLLELGAGNMQKTTLLLNAIDAHGIQLTYYALDVDHAELESSLSGLEARTNLQNIKLRGLLGTYEDGANWLSTAQEVRNKRKTLVWLGNSIANFTPHEASELLGSFTKLQAGQSLPGFVLGIDGCQDKSMIECAYDTPGGQSRRWIKYILEAARNHLGPEAAELLDDDNWRVEGGWDAQNLRFENYLSAAIPIACTIGDTRISIKRGERVHILRSGKWSKSDVGSICAKQSLDIAEWWNGLEVDYV
ncbi:Uncharacterized protein BP5553_04570 [Venustampulla echinocandica]|uniref:Histidine-specific methyltransferase SAM-dependent domain-containing protein n=1 Tax=Venustampulla echinocandica TaxID=2656787 RepID=A0A370TNP6_9HELO|nr:Uncharacterized protein BP5553_04570 [Venustampulla echinocandica]RDL37137.1 Uncharacterized protein BP5553_04570 [Venustampulla echinocandica]